MADDYFSTAVETPYGKLASEGNIYRMSATGDVYRICNGDTQDSVFGGNYLEPLRVTWNGEESANLFGNHKKQGSVESQEESGSPGSFPDLMPPMDGYHGYEDLYTGPDDFHGHSDLDSPDINHMAATGSLDYVHDLDMKVMDMRRDQKTVMPEPGGISEDETGYEQTHVKRRSKNVNHDKLKRDDFNRRHTINGPQSFLYSKQDLYTSRHSQDYDFVTSARNVSTYDTLDAHIYRTNLKLKREMDLKKEKNHYESNRPHNGHSEDTNSYIESPRTQVRYDTISGLSVKLISPVDSDLDIKSLDSKFKNLTRLSASYDSSLINRALNAPRVNSPDSSPLKPPSLHHSWPHASSFVAHYGTVRRPNGKHIQNHNHSSIDENGLYADHQGVNSSSTSHNSGTIPHTNGNSHPQRRTFLQNGTTSVQGYSTIQHRKPHQRPTSLHAGAFTPRNSPRETHLENIRDSPRHRDFPQTTPISQDMQLHHARQVFIRNRSQSLDQDYHKSNKQNAQEGYQSNSTPSTPSSLHSDPVVYNHPPPVHRTRGSSLKQNLQTITEGINAIFKPKAPVRTKSEGDLLRAKDYVIEEVEGDDYGFLRYPSFRSLHRQSLMRASVKAQSGMQKSSSGPLASSPSASRLLPRRWRTKKAKKGNSAPTWKPEGGCVWANSVSGRRLTLSPVSLVRLSEAERVVLKKLALARLQALQLGCSITVPKDCSKPRSKSRGFSLKRRTASGGLLDNLTGKENSSGSGRVFGIPLAHCIHNERQKLSVGKHPSSSARRESLSGMGLRKSSSSSGGAISSDSFSDVTDPLRGHQGNHSLLDALSLSSSATLEAARTAREYGVSQHNPHVPQVVRQCCQHIQAHGLQTLGIFRIGCSKKRTKQLREEYDAGGAVELGEEYSPHDIGGLLKEYFRDLPDPLLTRDLYTAWVATRKLASVPARVSAMQQLVCLLPAAHRDTLAALLHFLNTVAQHSTDSIDTHGQLLEGNKMGAHNLATLFGPNILHKSKGGEFRVESAERAEERGDVIAVVQELIEYHDDIFTLSRECHDEVLQTLQESNTEAVDILLKQKSASLRIDVDHETSSLYGGESDSSSLPPHTPSSLPGDQPGTQAPPRNLTEALASVTPLQHGPSATESSLRSDPATTPAPPRAAVADTQVSGSFSETLQVPAKHRLSTPDRASSTTGDKLQVPASYRLSAPEPPAWYNQHSTGRSLSPGASPRVSPAPKAMRSEIVIDPNSKITQARMLLTPKTNRRSMVETVTIEAPQSPNPSPADSSANMSARAQWFLDTPPSTPTGVPLHTVFDFANPLKRTSSTHRPLGVPTGNNNQTANLNDSNRPADESTNQKRMSQSGDQSSNHRHSQNLGKNLANTSQTNKAFAFLPNRSFDLIGNDSQEINSPHYVTNQRPESMPYDWQKERWKHWESMAKSHNDELVEQETLV